MSAEENEYQEEVCIEICSSEDIPQILELQGEYIEDGVLGTQHTKEELERIQDSIFVCREERRVIGYCIAMPKERAVLNDTNLERDTNTYQYEEKNISSYKWASLQYAVNKERKGMDIAPKLIEQVKHQLGLQDFELLVIETESNNQSTQRISQKQGAIKVGTRNVGEQDLFMSIIDIRS